MFFGSCLLQVMKKSSDNYHASLDGLFSSSNLEAGLSSRERERESSAGCERGESSSIHIRVQQPSPRPGSSSNSIIHTM